MSVVAHLGDTLMLPVMWSFVGFREGPQETHVWNNVQWPEEAIHHLKRSLMVSYQGDPNARKCSAIQAHLPVSLGGWKEYRVLRGHTAKKWYLGWKVGDAFAGISLIPIRGRVRVLIGPGPVEFFALNEDGFQIRIHHVGRGQIGVKGPYSWDTLR